MNLLLLPGLFNDERLWRGQMTDLADLAEVRVADLTRSDSITALAQDALDDLPDSNFVVAGMSMGGYVALEIMRQVPERVAALALLDTSPHADTPEAAQNRRELIEQSETDYDGVVTALIDKQLHPDHRRSDELVALVRSMAHDVGREAFVRQQHAIIGRADSRPHLGMIRCPTLILCGREDAITPVEVHEEMQAQIGSSRLVVVERCGHLSPLEQPEKVSDALRSLLRQLPA